MRHEVSLIVLYDRDGRFLLQHRTSDAKLLPDHWAFFGGGIDKGETRDDAVRRETLEEINYKLISPKFIHEEDFIESGIHYRIYVYIESFKGARGDLKLQEGQGWGWFNEYEIDKLKMIDRDRKIVKLIARHLEKNTDRVDKR